ncbi:energy transducer TonB [Saprospira grandis]|uniref:energy transducer TonB n=1 Tax=Saprospira grandis TaxID=1008 RepID=UPI0022DE1A31|nr:energy transducer TonB [Saprospira grandis]WBM74358.1 energy transducer TonB [Saprospira grandis]
MYYRYLFLFLFFVGGVQAAQAETAPQYIVEADTLVPETAEKKDAPLPDELSFPGHYIEEFSYYLKAHCPEDGSYEERDKCGDLALRDDLISALIYPKAAKEKSLEATVYIRYTVTAEGKMENIELAKLVGEEKMGFEEAALNAVKTVAKTAKWKVAKRNGEYISMQMIAPIKFKLEEQD